MSLSRLSQLILVFISVLALIGIWSGEPWQGLWRWPLALFILLIALERLRLQDAYAITRRIDSQPLLGELISFTLHIDNTANRQLILESQSDYPENLAGEQTVQTWRLNPHGSESRNFDVLPVRLGNTHLGDLFIKQLGDFGLCWWTRLRNDTLSFCVEPARLKDAPLFSGHNAIGKHHRSYPQHTGVELLELRDYRHGDSYKNIDWKATARRGKPVIRRFEREQRLEIAVLIDCGRASRTFIEGMDKLHHYVNIAAKLTEFAALQGDHIACLAYAQDVIAQAALGSGIRGVKRIRELLTTLSANNETTNALNAALAVTRLLKHRGLIIFLTELEQPEANAQLLKAGQLLSGKHQFLVATLAEPALEAVIRQPTEAWLYPYRQFAALEYGHGRELSRQQLCGCGVAVVVGQAAHLEQQVLTYYRQQRGRIAGA